MSAAEARRRAVHWAASRCHEIGLDLVDDPDDLAAWTELGRIAAGIRSAAATRAVAGMGALAETLVDVADRRVIDERVARELETAVTRLLVLSERASQVLDGPTWDEVEHTASMVPSVADDCARANLLADQ